MKHFTKKSVERLQAQYRYVMRLGDEAKVMQYASQLAAEISDMNVIFRLQEIDEQIKAQSRLSETIRDGIGGNCSDSDADWLFKVEDEIHRLREMVKATCRENGISYWRGIEESCSELVKIYDEMQSISALVEQEGTDDPNEAPYDPRLEERSEEDKERWRDLCASFSSEQGAIDFFTWCRQHNRSVDIGKHLFSIRKKFENTGRNGTMKGIVRELVFAGLVKQDDEDKFYQSLRAANYRQNQR